jgi:hypothetical protein
MQRPSSPQQPAATPQQGGLAGLVEQVTALGLHERDPRVLPLFQGLRSARPGSRIAERLTQQLTVLVQAAQEQNALTPFAVLPPSVLAGGQFTIAYQAVDHVPVRITTEELTQHTLIAGPSGSGKTNILLHLLLQIGLFIRLWIMDLKDDYRFLAARHPSMLTLTDRTRLSLLRVPPYLTVGQHLGIFVDTFADALWGGEGTKQVLTEALTILYRQTMSPSLVDLRLTLTELKRKGDTYQRVNAIDGACQRLKRIETQYPGIATTRAGLGVDDITNYSLYFPVTLLTEIEEFLFANLTTHLFIHHRSLGIRNQLTHLVILDEGLASFSRNNAHHINQTPLLLRPLGLSREFGIGYVPSTLSLSTTDLVLRGNTSTKILTPVEDHELQEAARTFGLNQDQTEYVRRSFTRGQCLIHIAHRTPTAVFAVHPPVLVDKNVTVADWQAALRRTEFLTPTEPTPTIHTPQPLLTTTPAPATPRATDQQPSPALTPSNTTTTTNRGSSPHPVIPSNRASERSSPPIALNKNQERLLRSVVERIAPVTAHYERLGLHPDDGNAARQQLVLLGLATVEALTVGSGRGRRSICLIPTSSGIERSGTKPPRGRRAPASAQHIFLAQEFARLLSGKAEAMVGTKSVDVLLTYRADKHAALGMALNTLASPPVNLTEGQVLAIEVEISSPEKTIPSNVTKNAGISLTIIAAMPKALPVAKRALAKLPHGLRRTATLIDALQLLDHLRANNAHPVREEDVPRS